MRLRHPSGRQVFLSASIPAPAYGDLAGVVAHLDAYAAMRERTGAGTLAAALTLPPPLAAELAVDSRARGRLRAELDARGLEVVTVDGVRYGGAEPDWTTTERLDYTLDLARVLVDLLPDDAVRGSVSTLGIGLREPAWTAAQDKEHRRIMGRLAGGLAEIAWHTGKAVRVGFQPEPGCIADSTAATVAALTRTDHDRLGVSLDLANLACAWEEPAEALARLAAAGLSVVKVRLAAAVEAADPAAAVGALRGYVEPGHRHQTTTKAGGYAPDLGEALRVFPPGPWRVRYHVPLGGAPAAPLTATTALWRAAARELLARGGVPGCDHVDVGAETWDVLPPGERPAVPAEAMAAEFTHARDELIALGLAPAVCAP
ncbi:TIM barrel protein [Spirilliplanes yamanashiensis]|uniref:Xylose isomerase n=1 Tax=Spirilliplanes yamanashiensis TaxID=42233 RepID=A0A8J3YE27_9ACTN|nr:TIM barrel protein [Spirilliplanes yamanashiensis]MDP9816570.1 sugar phosphate isomerase/epimerase [Spirilliplanes yamanashiensis]GIJ06097.1 xylose isomerase [Spirilliplanes yamanashiensis]